MIFANIFVRIVLTDLLTRFCLKLICSGVVGNFLLWERLHVVMFTYSIVIGGGGGGGGPE